MGVTEPEATLEEREAQLRRSVVRVLDQGRKVIGTGFIVADDLIVTCAHVVRDAFQGKEQGERIEFDLPSQEPIIATVERELFRDVDAQDVAFLRLDPEDARRLRTFQGGVRPLGLATSQGLEGTDLRGYAFPTVKPSGLLMTAKVVGPMVGSEGRRLQLSSPNISPGCSGGPLWDGQCRVIGMAASILKPDATGRHHDTTFMIAAEVLAEVCQALQLEKPSQPPVAEPEQVGAARLDVTLRSDKPTKPTKLAGLIFGIAAVLIGLAVFVIVRMNSEVLFEVQSKKQELKTVGGKQPFTAIGAAYCSSVRMKLVLKHNGRGSGNFDILELGTRITPYEGVLPSKCELDPTAVAPAGIVGAQTIKIYIHDSGTEARQVISRTDARPIKSSNWLESDTLGVSSGISLTPEDAPIYYDVVVNSDHSKPQLVTFFARYGPGSKDEVIADSIVILGGSAIPMPVLNPETKTREVAGSRSEPDDDLKTRLEEAIRAAHAGESDKAHRLATDILATLDLDGELSKQQRLVASEALLLRARGGADTNMPESEILADLDRAATLGHSEAMYEWAVHALVAALELQEAPDERIPERMREAAELGHLAAANAVSVLYTSPERDYWEMLVRVNGDPALFPDLQSIRTPDVAIIRSGIDKFGLSEIDMLYTGNGLPPRSPFVALQNDYTLRNAMDFLFRAFFDDDALATKSAVDVFREHRADFARPGLSDYYGAFVGPIPPGTPNIVPISRDIVPQLMSPGDEIVVRCGSDSHMAMVWAIDRDGGSIHLLDPFPEFWMTEHTSCTPSHDLKMPFPERTVVSMKLDELSAIVVAVFTLRDETTAAP